MAKRMLIDAAHPEEMRVVIAEGSQIHDFDFITVAKKQLKGNLYLAKITRVEPSLQAAFVEYGGNRQGFLPFSEIHPDYYQIPVSDRKRLMEEAESEQNFMEQVSESTGSERGGAPVSYTSHSSEYHEEGQSDAGEEVSSTSGSDLTSLMPALPPAAITDESTPPEDNASAEEGEPSTSHEKAEGFVVSSEPVTMEAEAGTESETASAEPVAAEGQEASASAETGEAAKTEEVETTGGGEADEARERRQRKTHFSKRYRIQEVVKRGQIVLVQVIKEERGTKGVSLSTYLSLPGRYCVLMPNSPREGGISRKINSGDDRKRLKQIISDLKLVKGMSVIIRTAGLDRTRAEIKRDFDYLVKLWNRIRDLTLSSNAPALIYEETDLIKRALRDQYTADIEEILVEGDAGYKAAKDFMKMILPSHTPKIKQYKEPTPLYYAYGIEDQLTLMHEPQVKLRSGGYIVINPTEALISIDVNSGRSTGERNIEETATKTNLEAAGEIARQLKLRDLAGLIVIDFIDMMESRNRRNVERAVKDALRTDRAKIQLGRISPFGLLEMSRQRLRPSISESTNIVCPHCEGRGIIRSNESICIEIVRHVEKEASTGQWQALKVNTSEAAAVYMLNTRRDLLRDIEQRYSIRLGVAIDHAQMGSGYTLEKVRASNAAGRAAPPEVSSSASPSSNEPQERGRRGGRGRGGGRRDGRGIEAPAPVQAPVAEPVAEIMEMAETGSIEEVREETGRPSDGGPRRRRGRRGGRGRNRRRDETPAVPGAPVTEDVSASAMPAEAEPGEPREHTQRRESRSGGGRGGRRKWRENDRDRGHGNENQRHRRDGTHTRDNRARTDDRVSDGSSLPAFTKQAPVREDPKPAPAARETVVSASATGTEDDRPANPRKGWWQKMIELEE